MPILLKIVISFVGSNDIWGNGFAHREMKDYCYFIMGNSTKKWTFGVQKYKKFFSTKKSSGTVLALSSRILLSSIALWYASVVSKNSFCSLWGWKVLLLFPTCMLCWTHFHTFHWLFFLLQLSHPVCFPLVVLKEKVEIYEYDFVAKM